LNSIRFETSSSNALPWRAGAAANAASPAARPRAAALAATFAGMKAGSARTEPAEVRGPEVGVPFRVEELGKDDGQAQSEEGPIERRVGEGREDPLSEGSLPDEWIEPQALGEPVQAREPRRGQEPVREAGDAPVAPELEDGHGVDGEAELLLEKALQGGEPVRSGEEAQERPGRQGRGRSQQGLGGGRKLPTTPLEALEKPCE
jgi:hypothetical protein